MKKSLLALTFIASSLAFGQNNGGIGDGFYTEGVDYAGFNWVQRGDNPSAIVQLEVQAEGVDPVFTTGETLRLVTQSGNALASAFAARLSEAVTLAEGQTITFSLKYRYVPPLLFGTENQDIYMTRAGIFLDTDGGDLVPAYKSADAAWAGYYGFIWMDDSVTNPLLSPPRVHILRRVTPGSAGGPLSGGTNLDETRSQTSFQADADPLLLTFSVTKTAEGLVVAMEVGKVSATEPAVALSYLDTNSLDAVDTFDTFTISFNGFLEAVISDLEVTVSGGSETWYGYEVRPDGYVDTGPNGWFSGFVWVENDPWIWSVTLGKWVYVPDDSGWVYLPK
ncbi:MAG: hypothetical protein AB3N33_09450 [Puniceicoccaceae bacterium]